LSERPLSPASAPQQRAAAALDPANLLALAALIAPPLALFAPLGEAPVLTLLALALVALDLRASIAAFARFAVPTALLAALALWGALSAFWSLAPEHSLLEAARFLALSAAGLVVFGAACRLPRAGRVRLGTALLIGAAIALALLQLELWDDQALARLLHEARPGRFFPVTYDRGLVLLVLVAFPSMALLAQRIGRWGAAVAALLILLTLFAFYSQAATLGMVAGLAAAALAWRAPRLAAVVMIVGVVAVAFVLPAVLPDGPTIARWHALLPLRNSTPHRLAIWHFVAERIGERPLLGWGMDASRAIPGGGALVQDVMPALQLGPVAQILPLHPHNTALQWRLELGLPGTAIALTLIAFILYRATRSATPATALGFAGAVLPVAMLSYGAWQAWWLSSLWLGASLIAATAAAPAADERGRTGPA
jgi:O-antigen ligase